MECKKYNKVPGLSPCLMDGFPGKVPRRDAGFNRFPTHFLPNKLRFRSTAGILFARHFSMNETIIITTGPDNLSRQDAGMDAGPASTGEAALADYVARWAATNPLSPEHVDCATTVMLKILDGKCKMKTEEKIIMTLLYDQVKTHRGERLGDDLHELIARARDQLTDEMKNFIYEQRVLAETMISRPVMKGFKTMIRQRGLFEDGKI